MEISYDNLLEIISLINSQNVNFLQKANSLLENAKFDFILFNHFIQIINLGDALGFTSSIILKNNNSKFHLLSNENDAFQLIVNSSLRSNLPIVKNLSSLVAEFLLGREEYFNFLVSNLNQPFLNLLYYSIKEIEYLNNNSSNMQKIVTYFKDSESQELHYKIIIIVTHSINASIYSQIEEFSIYLFAYFNNYINAGNNHSLKMLKKSEYKVIKAIILFFEKILKSLEFSQNFLFNIIEFLGEKLIVKMQLYEYELSQKLLMLKERNIKILKRIANHETDSLLSYCLCSNYVLHTSHLPQNSIIQYSEKFGFQMITFLISNYCKIEKNEANEWEKNSEEYYYKFSDSFQDTLKKESSNLIISILLNTTSRILIIENLINDLFNSLGNNSNNTIILRESFYFVLEILLDNDFELIKNIYKDIPEQLLDVLLKCIDFDLNIISNIKFILIRRIARIFNSAHFKITNRTKPDLAHLYTSKILNSSEGISDKCTILEICNYLSTIISDFNYTLNSKDFETFFNFLINSLKYVNEISSKSLVIQGLNCLYTRIIGEESVFANTFIDIIRNIWSISLYSEKNLFEKIIPTTNINIIDENKYKSDLYILRLRSIELAISIMAKANCSEEFIVSLYKILHFSFCSSKDFTNYIIIDSMKLFLMILRKKFSFDNELVQLFENLTKKRVEFVEDIYLYFLIMEEIILISDGKFEIKSNLTNLFLEYFEIEENIIYLTNLTELNFIKNRNEDIINEFYFLLKSKFSLTNSGETYEREIYILNSMIQLITRKICCYIEIGHGIEIIIQEILFLLKILLNLNMNLLNQQIIGYFVSTISLIAFQNENNKQNFKIFLSNETIEALKELLDHGINYLDSTLNEKNWLYCLNEKEEDSLSENCFPPHNRKDTLLKNDFILKIDRRKCIENLALFIKALSNIN